MISKCWSMFGDIEILYDTAKIHRILCARWKIAYCLLFNDVQAIVIKTTSFQNSPQVPKDNNVFLDNFCTLLCFGLFLVYTHKCMCDSNSLYIFAVSRLNLTGKLIWFTFHVSAQILLKCHLSELIWQVSSLQ